VRELEGLIIKRGNLSTAPWAQVDKAAMRSRLAEAAKAAKPGARDAVREVFAVAMGEMSEGAQKWLPHHEVTEGGEVILNRGGLVEAAQALTAGTGEMDALPAEMRQAAAEHLVRHYREAEMVPPPKLLQLAQGITGEQLEPVRAGEICGEMAVEDVPLAPWANLSKLLTGETDPMQVVVKVPVGYSKRGWYYTSKALQAIVGEVNSQGLPGFLGHQKAEDVATEFPPPVTHWVGGRFDPNVINRDKDGREISRGAAFFRGVVDKAAGDLKRWIRANVIRTVSIFGMPALATVGGETHVVDYKGMSIDWTPLGRPGMPTELVAIAGEMANTDEITGDRPNLTPQQQKGGSSTMDWKQKAQELLAAIRGGHTTWALVAGEMGMDVATAKQVLQAVSGEQYSRMTGADNVIGEMAPLFGLTATAQPGDVLAKVKEAVEASKTLAGEMAGVAQALGLGTDAKPADVKAKATALATEARENAKTAHNNLVDKVVGEMVLAEAARPLFKTLMGETSAHTTEEALKKHFGEMMERPEIKQALGSVFRENVIRTQVPSGEQHAGPGGSGSSNLTRKSVGI
jgi:hypothetical protein